MTDIKIFHSSRHTEARTQYCFVSLFLVSRPPKPAYQFAIPLERNLMFTLVYWKSQSWAWAWGAVDNSFFVWVCVYLLGAFFCMSNPFFYYLFFKFKITIMKEKFFSSWGTQSTFYEYNLLKMEEKKSHVLDYIKWI